MSELIVKFDDKITVGLNDAFVVANVSGYDHYIFVNVDPFDNFTPHILKHFSFPKRTMLVGPRLRVSNVCNKTSLNLDFYTYNFKDIFLNMIVNDAESLWLDFISEEKLESFKQIILTLRPEENPVGMDKLNKTHYIVNMKNNADKITITYLRKEFIDVSIFEKSISEKRVKFVEEIVAVEGEIVEETLEEVVANLEQSLAENVCEYLNDIVAENVEVEKAEERVEEPVIEKVENENVEDEKVEDEKVEEPLEEPLVEKFEVVHSVPCEEPLDACKETVVVVEETIDGFTVASKKMKNSKSKKFRVNYSTKNLI